MGQREFVAKNNFEGYRNTNSLFYTHEDVKIKEDDPEIEEKYRYNVIFCESGSDVFEKYQSNEYRPTSKRINIFIEKENPEKSNFFETAYAVIMGEERKELMQKLHENKGRISLENSIYEVKNLISWCDELAILNKNVNKQLLYNAIILELEKTNPKNEVDQLLDANSLISTLFFKGVKAIENWKLTEINYEYEKYYLDKSYKKATNFSNEKPDFKPLIPIPAPHQMYENSKALGFNKIMNLEYNFGEISFGLKDLAFGEYLEMVEEQFIANVTYLKKVLFEKLNKKFGGLLGKFKGILEEFIALFDKIKQLINNESVEKLALINALLCGVINGLLSLIQSIFWIFGVFIDNLPLYNLDEAYETFIKYNQEKLEFIEDLVDLISTNSKKIIEGIINIVTDSNTYKEIFNFVESLWKKVLGKLGAKSKYFWAYVIGALIFEIIVEIIIAFFTAGAGNAAKAAAKISKAIDKTKDALRNGVKVAKKTGKALNEHLNSLWQLLKKEFEELVEAIKSGNFVNWIKKKFFELTDDVEGLRKLNLAKWIHKFDKSFFNHLEGEVGLLSREINGKKWEYINEGQGGHNANKLGKTIRKRPYTNFKPNPPIDDLPFKADIDVLYRGYWLPKKQTSSMFPKNWKPERIQEEIAWVFENTVAKGLNKKTKIPTDVFNKYEGSTTTGFKIRIEVDDLGNIMNAFPII